MRSRSRRKKGQFSTISALLIAIIMVSAVIMTYATIRNLPFQESPKVLSSIQEMNLSIKQLLEFAVGYYGSILQVTGNVTYAKDLTSKYTQSGFSYIAHSYPQWNPSFEVKDKDLNFTTRWYEPTSYSIGNLSIRYSLSGLGISQIIYKTTSLLKIEILETVANQSKVRVTREEGEPDLTLSKENFFFYNYSDSTWKLINPTTEPTVFSNGTYLVRIPSGVEQSSYLLKVSDSRSVIVMAFFSNSKKPQYEYTFTWDSRYSSLTRDTIVVEALQNGTLRWLGQGLQLSTRGKPIYPIPVRALHVNQTVNGISREVPFQTEDWGSNYRIPLGLTSNASLFGDRQMLVFLVNHNVQKVTLWWDGRDTAKQTSYAWRNIYFNDDPAASSSYGVLNNGLLRLRVYLYGANKQIEATVVGGSTTNNAEFIRINGEEPVYGAKPAYVIYNGIVRDIVQQEAEWGTDGGSGGATNSPNVYSQMYFMLPANATYYTYATRLIFINSALSRAIDDLSAIQVSVSAGSPSPRTENGTNVSGYPIVSSERSVFYNRTSASFQTGWAHHWSEFISGSSGAGIMFTHDANRKLYTFDSITQKTGALYIPSSGSLIEFNPVERSSVSIDWTTPTAVYSKCGEDGSNPASNVRDGNTGTYWRHNTAESHWIILDLGKTRDISQIRIYQSSTASERWGQLTGVEVYVSNNPNSWGSAAWTGTLFASGWQETGTFSATGRYVKLVSKSTSASQRLYEVAFKYTLDVTWQGAVVTFDSRYEPIYPGPGGWKTPNAVYDRCGEDGSYPVSRAIDGDTGTSWRHSTSENHWIILDMGQTMNISQIRIYQSSTDTYRWGQSSGIQVFVSDNPGSWGSAVWTGTLDASGWQSSGTFSAQGRYVRLRSLSTSSSQRFYEIEVNAAPSGNTGLWVIVEYPPTVAVN